MHIDMGRSARSSRTWTWTWMGAPVCPRRGRRAEEEGDRLTEDTHGDRRMAMHHAPCTLHPAPYTLTACSSTKRGMHMPSF
jgi:hypothetical protein